MSAWLWLESRGKIISYWSSTNVLDQWVLKLWYGFLDWLLGRLWIRVLLSYNSGYCLTIYQNNLTYRGQIYSFIWHFCSHANLSSESEIKIRTEYISSELPSSHLISVGTDGPYQSAFGELEVFTDADTFWQMTNSFNGSIWSLAKSTQLEELGTLLGLQLFAPLAF